MQKTEIKELCRYSIKKNNGKIANKDNNYDGRKALHKLKTV